MLTLQTKFAERVIGGCFFGACEALTVKDCETKVDQFSVKQKLK